MLFWVVSCELKVPLHVSSLITLFSIIAGYASKENAHIWSQFVCRTLHMSIDDVCGGGGPSDLRWP